LVFLLDRRPAQALDECELALRIQPDDAEARRLKLTALLEMRRHDQVIEVCDGYLRSGSLSPELLELRGSAKVKRNDLAGAIEDYTLAISLRRGVPNLHCRRGWAYLLYGAAPLARRDFDEAIRLDPSCGEAYGGRASALIATGQYHEAAADAERSVLCSRVEPRTAYNAARSLAQAAESASGEVARRGRSDVETVRRYQDRALQVLDQAIRLTADDQRAAFWRDVVESDEALRIIRRFPGYSRLAEECKRLPQASAATNLNSRIDRPNDP
jgi:tetratricopeptide (TPR) repeat protein